MISWEIPFGRQNIKGFCDPGSLGFHGIFTKSFPPSPLLVTRPQTACRGMAGMECVAVSHQSHFSGFRMCRCGTETVNGVAPHLSFELGIPLRNDNSRGRDARVTFCSTWWKAVESLAPDRPRESHLSKLFLVQMRVQRKSKSDVVEFHFHSDSVTPAMPRHAVCG